MSTTKPDYTLDERELGEQKFLVVMRKWTLDQFAALVANSVRQGIDPVSQRVKKLEGERDTMRAELESLRAEVQALRAKSHGGALMLARR